VRTLKCSTHGLKEWRGEVVCSSCERVFTTHDPKLRTHAPLVCPCGSRLMPGTGASKTKAFSGRACCSECFALRQAGRGTT